MILNMLFLGGSPFPSPFEDIGPDPTEDGIGCVDYTVVEPLESDDIVTVGEVEAAPGTEVEIPIYLTNSVAIEAFQLVIGYDPEVFSPKFAAMEAFSFEGTFLSEEDVAPGFRALRPGPAEDIFVAALVPSFIHPVEVPPGTDRLVFKLVGQVSPDAVPGTTVDLEPVNGPDGDGVGPYGLRNELTYRGDARFLSLLPRTEPGVLRIIPDITIFRGDSNDDGAVDLSDASYTLNWLFSGGPEPVCPDAVDANDDGKLDISDPIAVLQTLFLGTVSIAPPYPERGLDTTPDTLGPCGSSGP
jgi:hypothetical protein